MRRYFAITDTTTINIMFTIATLGPEGSDSYQAAKQYNPSAEISLFHRVHDVFSAYIRDHINLAVIPIYNTREGAMHNALREITATKECYWVDNIVLPIHISLSSFDQYYQPETSIHTIIGRSSIFRQCQEFLNSNFPDATLMSVVKIEEAIEKTKTLGKGYALLETEELAKRHNLTLIKREIVEHNRTRFAVLARHPAVETGYDATAFITKPLKDRVGLLADILNEFTCRGISIIDLQADNDIKTQKLQIYVEFEGHRDETLIEETLNALEMDVIEEKGSLHIFGSFPRVDMREKHIKTFGFIGSGAMSQWFDERLRNEGYDTIVAGRSTTISPEEMINRVDVIIVCVPISVTAKTICKYGPQLRDGQALIILAGESENTIKAALASTSEGVELLFIHNLWGPQAVTMKDKNAIVVRTARSGPFCSEFEAFLYKHGADIYHDSPQKHDLLMGFVQKLPTTISVALAKTIKDHTIDYKDITSHSTLTSMYGILAMARVHNQNPRTYAEIISTTGEGRRIVRSFAENILQVVSLAEEGKIDALSTLIKENCQTMPADFLKCRMVEAKAVDEILSRPGIRKA